MITALEHCCETVSSISNPQFDSTSWQRISRFGRSPRVWWSWMVVGEILRSRGCCCGGSTFDSACWHCCHRSHSLPVILISILDWWCGRDQCLLSGGGRGVAVCRHSGNMNVNWKCQMEHKYDYRSRRTHSTVEQRAVLMTLSKILLSSLKRPSSQPTV